MDKAEYLRSIWGDKPCDHPTLDKEYYLGAQTGDYVCETCGACFNLEQLDENKRPKEGEKPRT